MSYLIKTILIGDEVTNSASEVKHNPCEQFRVVLEALEVNQRVEHSINDDQGEKEQNEDVDVDELMEEGNRTFLYHWFG
jgi:hypothetical protein